MASALAPRTPRLFKLLDKELQNIFLRNLMRRHTSSQFDQFIFGTSKGGSIHSKKSDGGGSTDPFVSISKAMVACQVKQICASHLGEAGMKKLAAKAGERLCDCRLDQLLIEDPSRSAIFFDLIGMDADHLMKFEKSNLHDHSAKRLSAPPKSRLTV